MMRDYDAAMKDGMTQEHAAYKAAGLNERAAAVADELWNVYGVDVDGSRSPQPTPTVQHVEPEAKAKPAAEDKPEEPRQKRKYTRRAPLERADQKAPETQVEAKPEPRGE